MDNQVIPLVTEIIPKYKGIYPPETIEVIHRGLRIQIDTLKPLVEANEKKPLITAEERANHEMGEGPREIALRSKNNEETRKALEASELAWERLVNGKAHLCTECGRIISKDRKQAMPTASKCMKCQKQTGISAR